MTRSLLRSAIGLALTSAMLTIVMFMLQSPLAAVFELSVCAGLIAVLFISTISLTESSTQEEKLQHARERLRRFWFLPVLVIVIGGIGFLFHMQCMLTLPPPELGVDVRTMLWHVRQIDMLGQMVILLAGVVGVVVLFKGVKKHD
jgi:NADH-quinone oxidoreductase subunit J